MPLHVLLITQMPRIKDISDHCLESMHIFISTVYIHFAYKSYILLMGSNTCNYFTSFFFFWEKCEILFVHINWLTQTVLMWNFKILQVLKSISHLRGGHLIRSFSLTTHFNILNIFWNIPNHLNAGFVRDFQYLNTLCISPMKSLYIYSKIRKNKIMK